MARIQPDNGSITATVRTALLCALAVSCAWAGRRWKRRELSWLQQALMMAGAVKLVAEDLPLGQSATLWISLVCFGGALIVAPRLSRQRATERPFDQTEAARMSDRRASFVGSHGNLDARGPH